MKSRVIAALIALAAAAVLAASTAAVAAPAVAAPAPPPPTVQLDEGLHLRVGTVIGDDADAHGCGEAECGFLGVRVPVYAKWHQAHVTAESGAAWSCNRWTGVECCWSNDQNLWMAPSAW